MIDLFYGPQTALAMENFKLGHQRVHRSLIEAIILVKKAACEANMGTGLLSPQKGEWIVKACDHLLSREFDHQFQAQFPVHPLQGGAGTSTHMNVNEVIAGLALTLQGLPKDAYHTLHPLDDVNMSQSTNDVYPTALRIASIYKLRHLAEVLADLQESFQEKERAFADVLKLGRTQLMDAVPITVGQSMGAYARAISRDRWRIYKVEERLREVNLGGTAVGTGLNAQVHYIFKVTEALQRISGLGLARSEYPVDTTQNADVFVEASGLLKASAVTLLKISSDLRLLSSGPKGGIGEYVLPERQAGSTIMPGKVNPVIAEMMGTVSMKVIANDLAITQAAGAGQLELNAFMPLIADALLESLDYMIQGVTLFNRHLVEGLGVNQDICWHHLEKSTGLVTALVHHLGYDTAAEVAKEMLDQQMTLEAVVVGRGLMDKETFKRLIKPTEITSPGIPGKRGTRP